MSNCCQDNPPCSNCGPCADCVEPKVIAVKRLGGISPCDTLDATIKDIFNSGFAKSCTLTITELLVSGSTVSVVSSIQSSAMEYSSDGILYQDSPVFSNQACGPRRYYVRDRTFIACLASKSVTLSIGCICFPNVKPVSPIEAECYQGFIRIRTSDGCGTFGWITTDDVCSGGCTPTAMHDVSPQQTRCQNNLIQILQWDGCQTFEWRNTQQACDVCSNPVVPPATTTQASCNQQGQVQNDAGFSIGPVSGADKYGYSTGSSYSGPSYSGASTLPGNNTINVTGLLGNSASTTYTVRFFNGKDGCVTDRIVTIPGKSCGTTCQYPEGQLIKTDPSCSGGVGTNGSLTYQNPINVTRWQLCENITFNCTPNYSTANVVSGSGNFVVKTGINFAADLAFKDFVLRLYNGSQECYVDAPFRFTNPCYTGPPCTTPGYNTPVVTLSTCNGTQHNNNAGIAISGITNGTKYGYSIGSSYDGPDYGSATTIVSSAITITGLNGSSSPTSYVIRIFNATNGCYIDVPVTVSGVTCTVPCELPQSGTLVGTAATCTGPTMNNNASISVPSLVNTTHFGYSLGDVYVGPAFGSATAVGGSSISITGIAGSISSRLFTVRLFNATGTCFVDKVVTVPGTACEPVCVNPTFNIASVAPTGCTGEASTNDGIIRISAIANGTRRQICIDTTFSCTPNYAGSPTISGSGPIDVFTALGFLSSEQSKTVWVRVYNGSETCYTDHSIVVNNPCKSCCGMTIDDIELTNI